MSYLAQNDHPLRRDADNPHHPSAISGNVPQDLINPNLKLMDILWVLTYSYRTFPGMNFN